MAHNGHINVVIGIYTSYILVLGEGLEPSRLAAPEPKSGISLPVIHPFRHEISLKVLIYKVESLSAHKHLLDEFRYFLRYLGHM